MLRKPKLDEVKLLRQGLTALSNFLPDKNEEIAFNEMAEPPFRRRLCFTENVYMD